MFYFVANKITVKIYRSKDSVEIKHYFRAAKSYKEERKMSDMWDIHSTEVWD